MAQAPPMADPEALGFDPWSVEFVANPYPVYTRLRQAGPIHYFEGTNQWVVPRHQDVSRLLRE